MKTRRAVRLVACAALAVIAAACGGPEEAPRGAPTASATRADGVFDCEPILNQDDAPPANADWLYQIRVHPYGCGWAPSQPAPTCSASSGRQCAGRGPGARCTLVYGVGFFSMSQAGTCAVTDPSESAPLCECLPCTLGKDGSCLLIPT
jgi:hypothetical protein